MSPTTGPSTALRRTLGVLLAGTLAVASVVISVSSAEAAGPSLTITPLGWNVVGLDSNSPTSAAGPARYAVGAKVCNTGTSTATSVVSTWAWTTANARITILGSAAKAAADLAAGACRYQWWTVDVQRVAASQNTSRGFQITASSSNAASVQTPTNREIYVEKLISQNRNSVTGSSGPTSVYVGGTYTWTFSYDTGSFNQVQAGAFLDPSIFEILSVSQNYSTGGANDQFYKDACGWINDTTLGTYRSCTNNLKVGGTISSTVTATVTGTGTSKISPLVLDFSGSSYHYNTDFSTSVYALTVTATAPPAPTLVDDSTTTPRSTSVLVDVLANDTPNAGTLDTSTLSVTAAPAHGTTSIVGGKVQYTPTTGYAGPDTFTYRVCTTFATCSTATVSITVTAPPTAVDDSATVATAVPTSISVLTNDSSPLGYGLTISSVGTPSHGSATISAGAIQYTSAAGYHGPDSFTYTISDGHSGTATATVSVTVGNLAPIADDDSASTASATAVTVDVLNGDTDADGDTLTISSVGTPTTGTAVISAGTILYTPVAGFRGDATFTYVVADGFGGTDTATVTVTVANAGPTATGDPATTSANTPVTVDVLANDTDPNGDTLTITSVGIPTSGTAVISAGKVVYTPAAGYHGPASFTYTISDGNGGTSSATVSVTVGNLAPVADDDSATTASGTAVTVDVLNGDTDPDGDTLTISSVGTPTSGTAVISAGTILYTPVAGFRGDATFTYVVSDGFGGTDTATVTVTVANAAPTATGDPATTAANTPVTVDVLANDTDPNGDTLTVTGTGAAGHGTVAINGDGTVTYTPTSGYHGPDSFTYTISDGHGGTATATVSVTVGNLAPVADDDSATTASGTAVTIDVLDGDVDPDGDALTITAVGSPASGFAVLSSGTILYTPVAGFRGDATFSYTVSDGFGGSDTATVTVTVANAGPTATGDPATTAANTPVTVDVLGNDGDVNGDTLTVTSTGVAGHGTVAINGDGTVTYSPTTGYHGPDSFTYTISDGFGGTATATVSVTVGNLAPIADDDSATTASGTAVTVDVLDGDTDPDGDTFSISSVGTPSSGTAVISAGTILYTPVAGFRGDATFTYVVSDGFGGTDTATVTVTVANAVPTATGDADTTIVGTPVTITVLTNDTDPNGDTLSVTGTGAAGHGTVVVNGDGTLTYAPTAGYIGPDSFTYTVSDGHGGTSTATVTVTVNGAGPTAVDDSATTPHGTPVTITVLGNDSDSDPAEVLSVASVGTPSHGTAQLVGNDVIYTPGAGYVGPDSFTYTITDFGGGTSTATVTVSVTNGVPTTAADETSLEHGAGASTTYDVLGNDSDPDGDALSLVSATGAAHGTATVVSGQVGYTPTSGYVGDDVVTYTVSDGLGGQSTGTLTVHVTNTAPLAVDDSATSDGTAVVVDVRGNDSDPNGDTLTVTAVGAPSHGAATLLAGVVTYTPVDGYSGPDSFTYTVSDGHGGTSTATVTITVDGSTPPSPVVAVAVTPACVSDAPYLRYVVSTVGAGRVGLTGAANATVTITWNDSTGRTVATYTGLASSGTILWPGAAVDASGHGSDWPGWIRTADGWVPGDDGFENTRAGSTLVFTSADGSAVATAAYPPASSACVAAPRLTTSVDSSATKAGTPVTIPVLGNDSGVDGGATVKVTSPPSHGTVVVKGDGTVVYVPDEGFTGTDTFTYTVTNANGLVSSSTVTVTVADASVSTPSPGGPELPHEHAHTGADVGGILGYGFAFLLAGALLLASGRRRERS